MANQSCMLERSAGIIKMNDRSVPPKCIYCINYTVEGDATAPVECTGAWASKRRARCSLTTGYRRTAHYFVFSHFNERSNILHHSALTVRSLCGVYENTTNCSLPAHDSYFCNTLQCKKTFFACCSNESSCSNQPHYMFRCKGFHRY